ncbi:MULTISPECIES: hypothetical protein [Pseudomonas syringae group]|nr:MULTISPECIES: hypothetical protein [Pseudomonas syringae group]
MNATATNAPTATNTEDYKKKYDETTEAANAGMHKGAAKDLAAKVIDTFYEVLTPKAELELQAQIKHAASINDFDALESLMSKRKEIKTNQAKDGNIIKEIRKHDFPLVLKAFRSEFDAVIYEIAYNVLTGTHKAIEEAAKPARAPRGSKTTESKPESSDRITTVYEISKDGKSFEFPIRAGRSKLSLDTEAFAFLGFKIELDEDKKEFLEPGTVKQKDGTETPATRKAIAQAIIDKLEGFEGFTIKNITQQ